MKNNFNKTKFSIYAFIYNLFVDNKLYLNSYKLQINKLAVKNKSSVLIIGCGTGIGFEFLPKNIQITAIDFSKNMLVKAKKRASSFNIQNICFSKMDAENLTFPNEKFDVILLNLVLGSINNPTKCLFEANRVLKKNGKVSIFDKFIKHDKGLIFRVLNGLSFILGSRLNLNLNKLLDQVNELYLIQLYPQKKRGYYKIAICQKVMFQKSLLSSFLDGKLVNCKGILDHYYIYFNDTFLNDNQLNIFYFNILAYINSNKYLLRLKSENTIDVKEFVLEQLKLSLGRKEIEKVNTYVSSLSEGCISEIHFDKYHNKKKIFSSIMEIIFYKIWYELFRDKYSLNVSHYYKNKNLKETFDAIIQSKFVFESQLFKHNIFKVFNNKEKISSLLLFVIQIGDEFLDGLKELYNAKIAISFLKKMFDNAKYEIDVDNVFELAIYSQSYFKSHGISLNHKNIKYNTSYIHLFEIMTSAFSSIQNELEKINKTEKQYLKNKINYFLHHSFSTYIDELIFKKDIKDDSFHKVNYDWHFKRKNYDVMYLWLEIKGICLGSRYKREQRDIFRWANFFVDFQLFDDLKDISVDFLKQPNKALYYAFNRYNSEAKCFLRNINLDNYCKGKYSIKDVFLINLYMPRTVYDIKNDARNIFNIHYSPTMKFIADYRWKKSWTSTIKTFHNKEKIDIRYILKVKQPETFKSKILFTFFELGEYLLNVTERDISKSIFYSIIFDLFLYQDFFLKKTYTFLLSRRKLLVKFLFYRIGLTDKEKENILLNIVKNEIRKTDFNILCCSKSKDFKRFVASDFVTHIN